VFRKMYADHEVPEMQKIVNNMEDQKGEKSQGR
jgi:hypothetical protein